MSARTVVVNADDDGVRVDKVVSRALGLGTAAVRRLCDGGQVRGPAGRLAAGDRVKAGMAITIAEVCWLTPVEAPLDVLATWANIVVVDKPAGLPCHPLVPGEGDSVVHRLVGRFPEIAAAAADPREGGLLHRLDTGTSGCLAVARDRSTWEALRAGLEGAIKTYLAVVVGTVAPSLVIDDAIGHDRGDRRRMVLDQDGAPCRTTARCLEQGRLATANGPLPVSLVRLELSGGRRHQLRVHMQSRGHPLLGDALYGGPAVDGAGFFLHAVALGLPGYPVVRAPVPLGWRHLLAAANCPWPDGAAFAGG